MAPRRQQEEDTVTRFKIADEVYEIDGNRLTFGESAEVEEHFGCDFHMLYTTQGLLALIYTAMKRKDDKTTWADAEALEIGSVTLDDKKRPTKAAPEAAGTPAS